MIRILPESLVNKIAAGEVIVRPASVVKELVENSIDAGATRIVIELANQCRDIRVRDDGCGIAREDLPRALLRHATSKIERFEDLFQLRTRGFRGEALASIAAVSRLIILSRAGGELAGARLTSEPGREPIIEPAGAPEGTDVWVRDLFANIPVRLKFLKSPAAELQLILYMITRQALIRPDIGFVVANERETLLDVPTQQPWRDRVLALLGMELADDLLELDAQRHDVTVRGFLVAPRSTRKDRRYQFFFVNGRPITSRSLSNIVQQAYKGLLMTQRFAIVVLDLGMPPDEVDVNVHPTKEEVRFRSEAKVLGILHKVIEERLAAANLIATFCSPENPAPSGRATQTEFLSPAQWLELQGRPSTLPGDFTEWILRPPASAPPSERLLRDVKEIVEGERQLEEVRWSESTLAPAGSGPDAEGGGCDVHPLRLETSGAATPAETDAHVAELLLSGGGYPEPLGQVADCYIVARAGDNLVLIDQHAAHERLLYMRLCERGVVSGVQPLLIPVTLDVPPEATPMVQGLLPALRELGLEVEYFGGHTFVVQAVPADLPNLDAGAVVADVVDDFLALGSATPPEVLRDRILTRMACRAAVKAGQRLQLEEMRQLIRDIVDSRMGFTCPHGRPTMILLTRAQLDRQFKRVV